MRVLAFLPALLIAGLAAPAASLAQQRPQFETTKVAGTENVYIYRYGNAQAMFVVTREGVIATDPIGYGKPAAVTTYIDEIKKVTSKPIKYVIYSHHHYDHIAGGKPFKALGATFVAHENAKRRIARLQDPNVVVPDKTVDDKDTIELGGTRIELYYLGRNHSDSTLVMRLPREKIIFAVDIVPVGGIPGRGMIDSYPLGWERTLAKLLTWDWERLIPGHPGPDGRLGTKDDVRFTLGFLRDASAEVKKAAQAGKCWQPAEKELIFPKYENMPDYVQNIPFVITRYCGLWGRGT